MKKLFYILFIFALSFCNSISTPDKTLKSYFDELISDKSFNTKYWDINEFCKTYYGSIWDNASEEDKKEQVLLIEKLAKNMVNSHKDVFDKIVIKEINALEASNDTAKYRVVFFIKDMANSDSYVDFVLRKYGSSWKIVNYERMKYGDKELVTSEVFKNNFNTLLENLGYKDKSIDLKVINEFMKNSMNLK